jgi:hypothetical protein
MYVDTYFRGRPKRCPACASTAIQLTNEPDGGHSEPPLVARWRCRDCGLVFRPAPRAAQAVAALVFGGIAVCVGAAAAFDAALGEGPVWRRGAGVVLAGGFLPFGVQLIRVGIQVWHLRGQTTIVQPPTSRNPDD